MAIPFLYTLGRTARSVFPFVNKGVRLGMSSRAIERSIRNAGIRISRGATILPMMRAIEALNISGANVRFVNKGAVINTAKLPFALTEMRREFSYRVRIDGLLPNGQRGSFFLNVATNDGRLSPGQIEDLAQQAFVANRANYEISPETFTLESGMRRV